MKNYTLLNAVTSATDGPAYVMKWERGQIFSLAVSGEFVATVKIYGFAGDAWFPVPLIDLANSKKVTEITETGYYAVLIPKLYSRIKAVTESYTSGAVTVVGTQTEGSFGVFAASLGATAAQLKEALQGSESVGPFNVETLPLSGGATEDIVFASEDEANAYLNKVNSADTIILQFTPDTENPDDDQIIAALISLQGKIVLHKGLFFTNDGHINAQFTAIVGIGNYILQAGPVLTEDNKTFYIGVDIISMS